MNTNQTNSKPLNLDDLEQQLNRLVAQGQHRFEPVQFELIKALLQRSKKSRPAISAAAIQQLANRIEQYQQHFQQAQQQAQQDCQFINEHNGQNNKQEANKTKQQLQQLLAQQQFKTISRLQQQVTRQQQRLQNPTHHALQQLTQSLLQNQSRESQTHTSHLDQQLQQHEATASAALINNSADHHQAHQKNINGELKSIALYRAAWAKRHIENLTDQAINNRPENAGPLNPERLASGSLTRIKALSPSYLNRFIGYVDTLLWLQQTEQQHEKAVKKIKK